MSKARFPGLEDSGYPKNYDVFNKEMVGMWDDVVPKERRAPLEGFGQYISGQEVSEHFATESATDKPLPAKVAGAVEVTLLSAPSGSGFSLRALKNRLFNSGD